MAGRVSRRKIAEAVADGLLSGDKHIVTRLAAYLIETKQVRSMHLMVRQIEIALAERGVLVADVTSAHNLTAVIEKEITDFLAQKTGAKTVKLRQTVDTGLIGGVVINTPNATLDTSIKGKLQQLKAAKQ